MQDCKTISFANYSLYFLLLYVVIQTLFGSNIVVLKATLRALIVPLLNVYSLSCLFRRYERKDFIQDFITVSTIAAIVSLLLFFMPSIAERIRDLTGATEQLNNDARDRGYGIASSLFSGYPLIQSWGAFLSLMYGKSKNKYIQFFLIFLSITFNARTSLFVLAAMILIHYFIFSSMKQIFTMLICVALGIGIFVFSGLYNQFADIFDFVLEAFLITSDFMLGTSFTNGAGHFSGLADTFLIWPDNLKEWIVGNGSYMLTGSAKGASDIGFIIQLNYGGIIYLLLLAYPVLHIIKELYNKKMWEFFWYLSITIILLDWKGDMFLQTNFVFLILSLYLNSYLFGNHAINLSNNSSL